eukprot:TRINITY_DN1634_c0_g1_i1.p1 TRINITY_DN1634_c0_g1~~TRINITY_DN1634_c0_g1_i1.p1  ORF type:complete len:588 (-),score=96.93 TRINITY_DN1634_c0_g1_i1:42-1805(-)
MNAELCPIIRKFDPEGVAGVNIQVTVIGTNAQGTTRLEEFNPVVRNKASALGVPTDTTVGRPAGYFSIGFGGQLIITMASPFREKLRLYELTYGSFEKCDFIEAVKVEVSDKIGPEAVWYDVGVYSNIDTIKPVTCAQRNVPGLEFDDISIIEIDLNQTITDPNAPNCFLYVRLTDRSNASVFLNAARPDTNADSFDLVGALSSYPCNCVDLCSSMYPTPDNTTIYGAELYAQNSTLGLRQDGNTVDPNLRKPDSPLGLPDNNPDDSYALGFGGQIIIEMSKWFSPYNVILWASSPENQCDPRLGETAVVEVSQSREGPWFYLAYRNTYTACIPTNTAPHVRSLGITFSGELALSRLWGNSHPNCFKYVRITDRTNPSIWEGTPDADGFNVNAVTAVYSCDCIDMKIPTPPQDLLSAASIAVTPLDISNDPDYQCTRANFYIQYPGVFAKEIILIDLVTNAVTTFRNHANSHYAYMRVGFYETKIVTTRVYQLGTISIKCGIDNILSDFVSDICITPPVGKTLISLVLKDEDGNVVSSWTSVNQRVCTVVVHGIYWINARYGRATESFSVKVYSNTEVTQFPIISTL